MFFSLILMFSFLDGKVDGPVLDGAHRYGGWPLGLPPQRPFLLGLRARLAEQWSSAKALFKSITPGHLLQYASLCGTSSLEMGVVLCPHVPGLHRDRSFSFIYYGTLLSNLSPSV